MAVKIRVVFPTERNTLMGRKEVTFPDDVQNEISKEVKKRIQDTDLQVRIARISAQEDGIGPTNSPTVEVLIRDSGVRKDLVDAVEKAAEKIVGANPRETQILLPDR